MIACLILAAIPRQLRKDSFPAQSARMSSRHLSMLSTAALYSISKAILSSTHGVPHTDRARLALMLQERYGGELPPRERDFKLRLQNLLTPKEVWWVRYLGKLGLVLAQLYPTGTVDPARPVCFQLLNGQVTWGKERMNGVLN